MSRAALALVSLVVAACGVLPTATVPTPRTAAEAKVALLAVPLVDVRTGERFALGTFGGRPVLVMAFAVW